MKNLMSSNIYDASFKHIIFIKVYFVRYAGNIGKSSIFKLLFYIFVVLF